MASINGLTTGLLGQLVDQWGALPPLSVQFISSNSGVDLPQPWERLTLDHVRALDTAVQTRPELARAIESAVQFSEKASYGMGRESPLNRYLADEDKALEIFRNL